MNVLMASAGNPSPVLCLRTLANVDEALANAGEALASAGKPWPMLPNVSHYLQQKVKAWGKEVLPFLL
ncbi:hypothetical protein R1flu_011748 [Riccia fluitans]|uniref:Uncharacterized protein n=1 Tax=Riccia fluitans TaxID=41844 RepID=A0ABD1Z917_9MARC